jgi:hypothetical protein
LKQTANNNSQSSTAKKQNAQSKLPTAAAYYLLQFINIINDATAKLPSNKVAWLLASGGWPAGGGG